MDLEYLFNLALLVFGFGFVIFWHELGHFLAAKWAGVRVEQFAVGFGQAILSWRKGIGLRFGSTQKEYQTRAREALVALEGGRATVHEVVETHDQQARLFTAADQLGLGETEYRLNWIPLGGDGKMLGQDDMDPTYTSPDPKAYNKKPVGKRMVIVSAGVVMNVILAAILFAVLFRWGFNVPPAEVGTLQPGSPAQLAGLEIGDTILTLNGTQQHDFNKILLNAALADPSEPAEITVQRVDGRVETLRISPQLSERLPSLRSMGFDPPRELRAVDPRRAQLPDESEMQYLSADAYVVRPGETIVAANGQPLEHTDYVGLDRIVQQSGGDPVTLTVRTIDGDTENRTIRPRFAPSFGQIDLNFAGLSPRAVIDSITPASPARDKIWPGDVVLGIKSPDRLEAYSGETLREQLLQAGANETSVGLIVQRGQGDSAEIIEVEPIVPNVKVSRNARGLGVALDADVEHPIVGAIAPNSPASRAKIPLGATIVSIDGKPVSDWHDINALLSAATPNEPVPIVASLHGNEQTHTMTLSESDLQSLRANRYILPLATLRGHLEPRATDSVLTAAWWGVTETRDMIQQFYLTIRRMLSRDIGLENLSGPVGIVHTGSLLAWRGTDWLIWFLAMISANLAVVNFLPIPIVDGGLFLFLLSEKITGRPPSPRTQTVAQLIGLTLIVGLFLFVTFNDVVRLFG